MTGGRITNQPYFRNISKSPSELKALRQDAGGPGNETTLPAMEGIRFDGKNRLCMERYVTFRKT